MQTFFEDKTAKVYYDVAADVLFLEYVGKVPSEDSFIKINTAVLDAFKSLRTQKFVADVRRMGVIGPSSQKWVVTNLLPGMKAHLKGKKLFHAQLLDPAEIMSKVSANNIKTKSTVEDASMEVRQFSDAVELKNYLTTLSL